jgi:hypothetical protein
VVGALVALELTTFATYARREITWAFPGCYDQAWYLTSTYSVVNDLSARGLPRATWGHLKGGHPAGVLLPLQAAVHNAILGHGRLAALSVNFVHLALFQCALVATLLWATRNWWVALAGFGLTLTLKTVFQPAGGAFDFRMDFVSFCLFGVYLCALIRSRVFLCPGWSAAAGLVAGVLVLFRFLTVVYLAGIAGVLLAAILYRYAAAAQPDAARRVKRRLRGWAISAAVLGIVAGPVLLHQRKAIRAYYVVGHVTSSEKDVRAAEYGVTGWADAALYYPRSVYTDHAGSAFWWAAGIVAGVGLIGRAASAVSARRAGGPPPGFPRVLPIALCGLAVPFLVLNVHGVKSPVVGVVLLPGLIWLALAPLAAAAWDGRLWLLRGAVVLVLLVGWVTQFNRASGPSFYSYLGEDGPRTMRAIDDLIDAVERKGIPAPECFFDANTHEFQSSVFQCAEFERRGRWREYRDGGTAVFAGDDEEIFRRLERADAVVLCGKPEGQFRYPYDVAMEKLRPRIRAYCEANLHRVGEYRIGGRPVTTYVRGHLRVEGASPDGWITEKGVRLVGTLGDLKGCRRIELHRAAKENLLRRTPGASAEVTVGERAPRPLAATVTPDLQSVCLDWAPVDLPAETPVAIHVRFDAAFVPRDVGIGRDDYRSLVMFVGPKPRAHLIQPTDARGPKE